MIKVFFVAKNEMRQQIRRKANWVGFLFLSSLLAYISIPPTPEHVNVGVCNDIAVECFIGGSVGGLMFLVVAVLCAGRLCNKNDDYYEILASTPLAKHQFYAGKILGNTFLYSSISFIMMLVFVPAYYINHTIDSNGLSAIPYFLLHFTFNCFIRILVGVTLLAMLDMLFHNGIVSSIFGLLYFLITKPVPNFIGYYLLIFNSYSYFNFSSQVLLVPSDYQEYLKSGQKCFIPGYTQQAGILSFFVVGAIIAVFYLIGLAVFHRTEAGGSQKHIIFGKAHAAVR